MIVHEGKYVLTELSVDDIFSYLFTTVTLQHILVRSQVIRGIPARVLTFCTVKLKLEQKEKPAEGENWFILLAQRPGTLRLLLPNHDLAAAVLGDISLWAIEECPSLSLQYASIPCNWENKSLHAAVRAAKLSLHEKKMLGLRPPRPIWPFCRMDWRDGCPVVDRDENGQYVSLSSKLLAMSAAPSQEREEMLWRSKAFASLFSKRTGFNWEITAEKLCNACPGRKYALVRLRARNISSLFHDVQNKSEKSPIEEQIAAGLNLERSVEEASATALISGIEKAVIEDLQGMVCERKSYIMPLRILMRLGDELLLIIRSDIAFAFVEAYASVYEQSMHQEGYESFLDIGMAVMNASYPLTRSLKLCGELLENVTASAGDSLVSMLDYVVVTNDIEQNIRLLRQNSYTARDGSLLTGKPFVCGRQAGKVEKREGQFCLADILADTRELAAHLSSSALRSAIDECRNGTAYARRAWEKIHNNLLCAASEKKEALSVFERIFARNFFLERKGGPALTLLGDYLELRHLIVSPRES